MRGRESSRPHVRGGSAHELAAIPEAHGFIKFVFIDSLLLLLLKLAAHARLSGSSIRVGQKVLITMLSAMGRATESKPGAFPGASFRNRP